MKVGFIVLFGATLILLAQGQDDDDDGGYAELTEGIEKFSLELWQRLAIWVEPRHDDSYMLASFSVWAIMLVLYVGAEGRTRTQLRDSLGITVDEEEMNEFYRDRRILINTTTPEMVVHTLQNLYYDRNYHIDQQYRSVVLENGTTPWPLAFSQNIVRINDDIKYETSGFIKQRYEQRNISGARMLLLSAIYFKAKWKYPFDKKLTKKEPFYSEEDGKQLSKMPMMVQTGKFAYVDDIDELDARVLELPYGKKGLVMLVMLPTNGAKITDTVNQLRYMGMSPVLDALKKRTTKNKEVEVKIPKFDTYTRYYLTKFLSEIGIVDVVDSYKADLYRMTSDTHNGVRMSLSNCNQFSRIVVDEEGIKGSTPRPAPKNKTGVVKFHLNKPFVYVIFEKEKNLMLYVGAVRNLTTEPATLER
ncbi:serine protease inhibitor 77Ba-like [Drosophila takahashii]|uniref:serine protease inhibitor 77Ba-like n=1 Tax=Drosophila takahashii TaxID=29030 RepID=UPI001CF8E41F|nr:serine protease inhibitor 77Ba-like [Drosophila takahashii]XP_017006395.2 serine protease inhibitor 77Ba-like [Drosophila takahashii]